jgi:hypothetical protein
MLILRGFRMPAKRIAYTIIILGILLSLLTSFVPHAPGAVKLSWGLLFWSLLPYLIYLCLTDILDGAELMAPGFFVLILDIYIQIHLYVFPDSSADNVIITYLPIWLTVLVLPLGWVVGSQLTKKANNH